MRPEDVDAVTALHVTVRRIAFAPCVPPALLDSRPVSERRSYWAEVTASPDLGRSLFAHVVTDADGPIVGLAAAGSPRHPLPGSDVEIRQIYVSPAHQRRGAGRRLMDRLFADLAGAGFPSVHLWTPEGNAPARAFYERLGGRLAGELMFGTPPDTSRSVAYSWSLGS